MLLIKNGRVLDPARKTDAALEVLVDGEKIAEVAPAGKISAGDTEIFDATGLIVAPGFIDLHAHLREPGQESSESIETGTRAAARGGFTAVCCMPNTNPSTTAPASRASFLIALKSRPAFTCGPSARQASVAKARPSRKSRP